MSETVAGHRVLPTLNEDGSRRWIRPRLFKGRHYKARLAVAWMLIVLFVAIPFIEMGGKPLILLDVPRREFVLFGRTFLPTDGVLLMLLLLSIFVAIILLSALFGRVWCGWGCPQTVYMEFVFRPIERLFDGGRWRQKQRAGEGWTVRRVLKHLTFAAVAFLLGNVFLAYFVGVERLSHWMLQSPLKHPQGFLIMAVTAGLVLFDFAYFREQMCTVVCPYARLQSVLLDKHSLIVGYDYNRGEPRGRKASGDCTDCGACVVACPTGIDIRSGLQLECIACTQCIDACNGVMDKMKRPRGLIRYTSQSALEQRREVRRWLRPRTIVYPVILAGLVSALFFLGGSPSVADVTLLRGVGAPFTESALDIQNQVRVKIRNRSGEEKQFRVELLDLPSARLVSGENPVRVAAGEQVTVGVFVLAPRDVFSNGTRSVRFQLSDGEGYVLVLPYKLLGPTRGAGGS